MRRLSIRSRQVWCSQFTSEPQLGASPMIVMRILLGAFRRQQSSPIVNLVAEPADAATQHSGYIVVDVAFAI
jgi:hypothetical protein